MMSETSSSATSQNADRQTASNERPLRHAGSIDEFASRHIGPRASEIDEMLQVLGFSHLEAFTRSAVPAAIRTERAFELPEPLTEAEALRTLGEIASRNRVFRSWIGMGYADCITPPVIQRNILENPGWYTQYTPYQAEIAQGRLEALLNFQSMVSDLTGLDVANASLLDEATAAAEAMALCFNARKTPDRRRFFVADHCHPQTVAVLRTRARPLGIELVVDAPERCDFDNSLFGLLLQFPATDGRLYDYESWVEAAHRAGALVVVAADLLSLTILRSPGEFGADIAVGNTQRFGVPLGYGGPHAAYFATRSTFKRQVPGRIVGVSKDSTGRPGFRLALQTREQHIRRDKATSNICTAQVLLAIIASMFAVYHGPEGLRQIALRVRRLTAALAHGLSRLGCRIENDLFFDTLRISPERPVHAVLQEARRRQVNLRHFSDQELGVALDEVTSDNDIRLLLEIFNAGQPCPFDLDESGTAPVPALPEALLRTAPILSHPVFHRYHSETEMLRYLRRLESRDLSLGHSMIPLGSCTMKLNATSEMLPVTWPHFARLHPFAPEDQAEGYRVVIDDLERWLAHLTGFAAVSLQPNAGSQGEYAGLLSIQAYHLSRDQGHRRVCLIPTSAHGTNPASAVMAGLRVIPVACDSHGNVDLDDLRKKIQDHGEDVAALMVTYPSTHGVFEEGIREICRIVHEAGGQVYMDGANLNAQVGLCRPAELGADVCHINLHKTFCIPHGGGGPGMGPICVADHLAPFLPSHPVVPQQGRRLGTVSAAPWGSPSIVTISWMYIRMMGITGLTRATQVAILNANYVAHRLDPYFPVLFRGNNGLVAHECIIDFRRFKSVNVEDVAKRLMDYGFHAPTISWPVAGTMMIEPTESESKEELDRFCEALIAIHGEIAAIESGHADSHNNLLKNAPHTAEALLSDKWDRPYSRDQAAFPLPWVRERKFWPAVGRIDNVYGDRNLVCTCAGMEAFAGS